MLTTVDIAPDVLEYAGEIAEYEKLSLGEAISKLARGACLCR